MAATKTTVACVGVLFFSIPLWLSVLITRNTVMPVPVCPQSYPREGILLTQVQPDWQGEFHGSLSLKDVGVTVGEATHSTLLLPRLKQTTLGIEVTYAGLRQYPKKRWLACSYGDVRLYKQLDASISQCVVRYAGKLNVPQYECK